MSDTADSNDATLSRSPGLGMEPKSILIGDRLRHTVHDGALKMPAQAVELIKQHSVPLQPPNEVIELPSVDYIIRPTLNKRPIAVTYLREEEGFMVPSDEKDVLPISTNRTVAVNQIWNPAILTPDPDRLRGGGINEETLDTNTTDATPSRETPVEDALAETMHDVVSSQPPNDSSAIEIISEPAAVAVELISVSPVTSTGAAPSESLIKQPSGLAQPALTTSPLVDIKADLAPENSTCGEPSGSLIKPPPSFTQIAPTRSPSVEIQAESAPETTIGAVRAESLKDKSQGLTQSGPTSLPPVKIKSEPATATSADAAPAESLIKQAPSLTQSATCVTQVASPQVVTSSSSSVPAKTATPVAPSSQPVLTLSKVPPPQYAQHIPGPNDEMQVEIKNARAPWYKKDSISEIERTLLPEWFDCSAQHRTPDSYVKAREQVLQMSTQLGNRFITNTLIRRTIPGDAGSLNRLFHFLLSFGFINADAINDSTPTTAALRDSKKRSVPTILEDKLASIILKRHKVDSGAINWQVVADEIGDGATAAECQKGFLSLDLDVVHPAAYMERSITPDPLDKLEARSTRYHGFKIDDLLANTDDMVVTAAVENALQQTGNLVQARSAAIIALLASQAAQKAIAEEDALAHVLAELNEKRMQRLEKRIELLNDVEGMMEAERMALELERRDLYTARCRHWFGGSS